MQVVAVHPGDLEETGVCHSTVPPTPPNLQYRSWSKQEALRLGWQRLTAVISDVQIHPELQLDRGLAAPPLCDGRD